MKKLFYLLFAGALLLPFSCNQNDKTKTDEVKMEEPSTKHAATVIHFKDQNPTLSIQGTDAAVTKLEFMEASRFLLRYNAPTKAAEPAEKVLAGRFSFHNGVYEIPGIGSVKINGSAVEITPHSGEPVSINATVTPTTTSNDPLFNAARNWKVEDVILTLKGGSIAIEKKFDGCNLEEMAKYATEHGVLLDVKQFKGMDVDEIILSGANTFLITFKNADVEPFYGTFNIDGERFDYKLVKGNDLLNVDAEGHLIFTEKGKCNLKISVATTYVNGVFYRGNAEFDLYESE